jgi:hypothetical protein
MSSERNSPLKSFYKNNSDPFTKEVKSIARQSFYKNLPRFKFGFELETQSLVGRTCDNWRNSCSYENERYDLDAFEMAKNAANDALLDTKFSEVSEHMFRYFSTFLDYLTLERFIRSKYPRRYPSRHFNADRRGILSQLLRENQEITVRMYRSWLTNRQPRSRQATLISRMIGNLIHYSNGCNYGFFTNETNPYFVNKENFRIINPNPEPTFNSVNSYFSHYAKSSLEPHGHIRVPYVEYGTDATVKGPEIRTVGGLGISAIRQSLVALEHLPKTVDSNCSFHVHFSVDKVSIGSYKADFHLALYEGLLNHLHELPDEVKDRISKASWRDRYFGFNATTDKYVAVAWRSHTWEFRCFGGVSSYKDQLKCVMVAAKAFYWACRAYSGKEKRFLLHANQLGNSGFYSKAIDRVVRGKTPTVFTSVIRQLRDAGNVDDMLPERIKKDRLRTVTCLNVPSAPNTVNQWVEPVRIDWTALNTLNTVSVTDSTFFPLENIEYTSSTQGEQQDV